MKLHAAPALFIQPSAYSLDASGQGCHGRFASKFDFRSWRMAEVALKKFSAHFV